MKFGAGDAVAAPCAPTRPQRLVRVAFGLAGCDFSLAGRVWSRVWAGFPIVDVGVEVDDGNYHDVDSATVSFQLAVERACVEGFAKASAILPESFVDVVIHVPERFAGEVAGSLSANRGRLSGVEAETEIQRIQAQSPFSAMLDYATQLRLIKAGEGSFSMRHSNKEPVPPHL